MRLSPLIPRLLGCLTLLATTGCSGRVALEPVQMGVQARRGQQTGQQTSDAGVQAVSPRRPALLGTGPRRPLQVGVWIPHWHKARGSRSVKANIRLFDSVSAFGFLVKAGGRIDDTLRHRRGDWRRLHAAARLQGVEILPTLAWARARDIHLVMSSTPARRKHVADIVKLAVQRRFRGVDIDYEGKLMSTRGYFSRFLEELSGALHRHGKILSCTVEARTSDAPPKSHKARARFPWTNDLATLGRVCDRVRIMAYDQWFAERGATSWTGRTRRPRAPNADLSWVLKVVQHFVRYVDVQKLELGVPTYGWLFGAQGKAGAWKHTRISALSHARLLRLKKRFRGRTSRTAGGEFGISYRRQGQHRVGTVCDAPCVRDRIRLAERLGLRGVVLFKIEGEEDPQLLHALAQERRRMAPRSTTAPRSCPGHLKH